MYYILGVIGKKHDSIRYVRCSVVIIGIAGGLAAILLGKLLAAWGERSSIIAVSVSAVAVVILLMNELLDYVMQMEQIPAEQKHIQLLLEKNSPVQTDFIGDATRLEQCLTNLISNAVKFTPENGTIRIGYESVAAENGLLLVRLSVADNGIGMTRYSVMPAARPGLMIF